MVPVFFITVIFSSINEDATVIYSGAQIITKPIAIIINHGYDILMFIQRKVI
jgi:hypothetical protein